MTKAFAWFHCLGRKRQGQVRNKVIIQTNGTIVPPFSLSLAITGSDPMAQYMQALSQRTTFTFSICQTLPVLLHLQKQQDRKKSRL